MLGNALAFGCSLGDLKFDLEGEGGAPGKTTGADMTGSSRGGASGTGGAASTASNGGSPATTGTSPTHETECSDGQDNDQDGAVDCADSDCKSAGYTCVDAPKGWKGPGVLYEDASADVPSCPKELPTKALLAHVGPSSPSFECNACACSSPCAVQNLSLYVDTSDVTCTATTPIALPQSQQCQGKGLSMPPGSVRANKPTVQSTCAPSGGGIKGALPMLSWSKTALACSGPENRAGCMGGRSCLPPPSSPFSALCVWKSGAQDCPNGPFQQKRLYYEATIDSRGCTPCACGAPGSGTCQATTLLFSDTNCMTQVGTVNNDGLCQPANSAQSFMVKIQGSSPTCTPIGSTQTGEVKDDPGSAVTACCTN